MPRTKRIENINPSSMEMLHNIMVKTQIVNDIINNLPSYEEEEQNNVIEHIRKMLVGYAMGGTI